MSELETKLRGRKAVSVSTAVASTPKPEQQQEQQFNEQRQSGDVTLAPTATASPPITPASAEAPLVPPSRRRRSSSVHRSVQLCHLLADLKQLAELPPGFDRPLTWQEQGGYHRMCVG